MSYMEFRLAEELMEMRKEGAQQWSESCHLLRQAKLVRPSWFSQQRCWLLCQLGRMLVALGERLERYALARSLSFGGEMG
jgi:hypothetical protein